MQRFELPMVDAGVPLAEAASAAVARNLGGVVVRHPGEYRLLHLDDLRRAFERNVVFAGDVDSFAPLAVSNQPPGLAAPPTQADLEQLGARFMFLRANGGEAVLL